MGNDVWKISDLTPYLDETVDTDRIYIHQCLASTNDTSKDMAKEGCVHGTVVIANKQTAGRGRFNRNFYSPEGTGLYMSVVLDADKLGLKEYTLLTPLVAVVVSRVIHSKTGKNCGIKWVNDLYIEDKKICGILTEGVMNEGTLDKFVVGIGINIGTSEFPTELKTIAGAIVNEGDEWNIRNEITAGLINELTKENLFEEYESYMREYMDKQILIEKTVNVLDIKENYVAKVMGVDSKGCLQVVRLEGDNAGKMESLNSGEVSIRRI